MSNVPNYGAFGGRSYYPNGGNSRKKAVSEPIFIGRNIQGSDVQTDGEHSAGYSPLKQQIQELQVEKIKTNALFRGVGSVADCLDCILVIWSGVVALIVSGLRSKEESEPLTELQLSFATVITVFRAFSAFTIQWTSDKKSKPIYNLYIGLSCMGSSLLSLACQGAMFYNKPDMVILGLSVCQLSIETIRAFVVIVSDCKSGRCIQLPEPMNDARHLLGCDVSTISLPESSIYKGLSNISVPMTSIFADCAQNETHKYRKFAFILKISCTAVNLLFCKIKECIQFYKLYKSPFKHQQEMQPLNNHMSEQIT